MLGKLTESRLKQIKASLIDLCHDSGIFTTENIEDVFHDDLIETGLIDSMGVVCLQDQIETRYKVAISTEQFVAELHSLDKLVNYLANNAAAQVLA